MKFVEGLKEGVASVAKLKQKKLFILYTFLIWVCYYLMTYFWFFVFEETLLLGYVSAYVYQILFFLTYY